MKWALHNSPVALPDINYQDQNLTNRETTNCEDKIHSLVLCKIGLISKHNTGFSQAKSNKNAQRKDSCNFAFRTLSILEKHIFKLFYH